MIDKEHPFKIKVLMVYEGINGNNATSRAVRTLKEELENQDVKVVVSESLADAEALISADPTIQCLLLKLDEKSQTCCQHAGEVLEVLRLLLLSVLAAASVGRRIRESSSDIRIFCDAGKSSCSFR